MLCFLCEAYRAFPESTWGRVWSDDKSDPGRSTHFFVGHQTTLADLHKTAGEGCHLCNLILAALEDGAKLKKTSLDSRKNESIYLHIWRDWSHNIITGDDRDECRIDPICTAAEMSLVPTLLTQEPAKDSKQPSFIKGELRCSLAPFDAGPDRTGSSPSNTSTGSYENLNLIRTWWNFCLMKHQTCRQTFQSLPPLPTRVIDVGDETATSCQLIETNHKNGTYLALSHCWGRAPLLTTTLESLPTRMAKIPDADLPSTFKDAVQMCRRLKIQYLWIDSLCIVQDSPEDWRAESAVMGQVYSHAAAVLAALSAEDSRGGLFWPRNGTATFPCLLTLFHKACLVERHPNAMVEVYGDLRLDFAGPMPLLRRAWVLQEQILASRTIGFRSDEIFWNCLERSASEKHQIGLPGIPQVRMDIYARLKDVIFQTEIFKSMPADRVYGLWYRTIMEYKERDLTRVTDIFPAISALAKAFATAVDDFYIAGLWANDLHTGLLWRVNGLWRTNKTAPQRSLDQDLPSAPSWSWASTRESVWYEHIVPSLDLDERVSLDRYTVFHGVDYEPLHPEYPYGELSYAHLSARGPLLVANLAIADQEDPLAESRPTWRLTVPSGNADTTAAKEDRAPVFLSNCHFDDEHPLPGRYTCALIATTTAEIPDYLVRMQAWALILTAVDGKEGGYRRVGLCAVHHEELLCFENATIEQYVLL